MEDAAREALVAQLAETFGAAVDVTPAPDQPLHVLLPAVDLPSPWRPAQTRVLTIWNGWPTTRPDFYIDMTVVGEAGAPPRSCSEAYLLGQTWRAFSFTFDWTGDDPVLAIQRWLTRFTREPS